MMMRKVVLGALVASLAVPVGARAAEGFTLTGGDLGPGRRAYELTSDRSPVSLVYDLKFDRKPQTVGKWVYNTDGSFRNGFRFMAWPARTKLDAHVEATEGIDYEVGRVNRGT